LLNAQQSPFPRKMCRLQSSPEYARLLRLALSSSLLRKLSEEFSLGASQKYGTESGNLLTGPVAEERQDPKLPIRVFRRCTQDGSMDSRCFRSARRFRRWSRLERLESETTSLSMWTVVTTASRFKTHNPLIPNSTGFGLVGAFPSKSSSTKGKERCHHKNGKSQRPSSSRKRPA